MTKYIHTGTYYGNDLNTFRKTYLEWILAIREVIEKQGILKDYVCIFNEGIIETKGGDLYEIWIKSDIAEIMVKDFGKQIIEYVFVKGSYEIEHYFDSKKYKLFWQVPYEAISEESFTELMEDLCDHIKFVAPVLFKHKKSIKKD